MLYHDSMEILTEDHIKGAQRHLNLMGFNPIDLVKKALIGPVENKEEEYLDRKVFKTTTTTRRIGKVKHESRKRTTFFMTAILMPPECLERGDEHRVPVYPHASFCFIPDGTKESIVIKESQRRAFYLKFDAIKYACYWFLFRYGNQFHQHPDIDRVLNINFEQQLVAETCYSKDDEDFDQKKEDAKLKRKNRRGKANKTKQAKITPAPKKKCVRKQPAKKNNATNQQKFLPIGNLRHIAAYRVFYDKTYLKARMKPTMVALKYNTGGVAYYLVDGMGKPISKLLLRRPVGLARQYPDNSVKHEFRYFFGVFGPLKVTDQNYKGSKHNVGVTWLNGEITQEPIEWLLEDAYSECYDYLEGGGYFKKKGLGYVKNRK